MAKILLIQPPIYKSEYTARGSEHMLSILPPMGLAYIAAYLQKHDHYCEIMDGMAYPFKLNVLLEKAPLFDCIGITAVSTFASRVHELIDVLKTNNIKTPIIVGGPHATVLPESCLKHGADYVVMGEGEVTMLELVNAITSGDDPRNIKGVAFLNGNTFCKTSGRKLIDNLNDIPLPARELLPMDKYKSSGARAKKQPSHSLFTSRGCPGYCSFCNKLIFGTRVRYFGVDRIVEEFLLLKEKYGAQDVAIWDDNFLADREFAHDVCAALIKNKFSRSWSIEARIDSVDRDILQHAKKAGCDFIAYGIESGSQRVLDAMNKRITLEQIRQVIKMTQEVGINIRAYFMMGMPYETLADMDKTISFSQELNVDIATFTLFVPLPGTLDYKRARQTGTFPQPEYYFHKVYPEFNFPDAPLYIPDGMTAKELLAKHKKAYNQYYFRWRYLLKSLLSIRTSQDVIRNIKGMLNLIGNAFTKIGN